ncbi:MAG: MrpF/PhaF family protein [Actinobacteria bacterium]|nr:MrpF/PhaF family protein [Actinomycetota bacterium]
MGHVTAVDLAVVGLLIALAIAGAGALTGDVGTRLVAAQLVGVIAVLITLVLSARHAHDSYSDVALVFALIILVGGLTVTRFLERWL